jgi:hypothetical protein
VPGKVGVAGSEEALPFFVDNISRSRFPAFLEPHCRSRQVAQALRGIRGRLTVPIEAGELVCQPLLMIDAWGARQTRLAYIFTRDNAALYVRNSVC